MCGIGGILRTDGQPIPEEWLDLIDARIAYRGPDGHGRFRDRVEIVDPLAPAGRRVVEVAFVHRRLSIIDHAGGHQPMVSPRGRNEKEGLVAVVFNGCIYNHRELRKELESKGHTFTTDHSDTEVLIHGWREWREHLIDHLEGMYAFAIWDRSTATLFAKRDAFGEKPLYLRGEDSPGSIMIASSDAQAVGTLTRAMGPPPHEWVRRYLRSGYNDRGWSPYGGIDCLYGNPQQADVVLNQPVNPFENLGVEEYEGFATDPCAITTVSAQEIEQLLEAAVGSRLDADVPLGCFLSGGIDSSLVTLFAKRRRHDIATFSVRMPDHRYDESEHAARVAAHFDTRHTTLDVSFDPSGDLISLISILGQPFGDSSILPTYWVSRAARAHVKVAVSGDGGDELFVGYERYLAARHLSRHWRLLRLIPRRLFRSRSNGLLSKFARLGDMARDFPRLGIDVTESLFTENDLAELTGMTAGPDDMPPRYEDAMAALRHNDVINYLPNDLLTKVDTASMACGLEVRCPFLDRDLARAALSMPIDQLMPGGQRKGLLRQIARKYLPKEIVDRPKMGFAIPIGEWFRNDDLPHKGSGMKALLLDHLNSTEPFGPINLNRKAVQRFIDEHMSCKRDHGQRLFTLLTLSIWARQIVNRQSSI